jgi:8-oxo-dGTP pyrophosphatase MutT (NUDIX family)
LAVDPAGELVVIVDRDNNITGSATRRQMRAERLPHRCTYILVFNSRGELYVQKRTMTKDIYPGYWDPAAGGVMQVGESYEQSAAREVDEELGVRGVELRPLFDLWFEDERSAVWGRAFTCVYDLPLTLQAEEVESVELMTPGEVLRRAEAGEPFTPDGLIVVTRHMNVMGGLQAAYNPK